MNEKTYKELYEQNSKGISSVYESKTELTEFKMVIEKHIEGDKLRDYKLDNLIKIITISNGEKSVMSRLKTIERYVAYVIGGAAVLGIIWGVIVFIVPLWMRSKI